MSQKRTLSGWLTNRYLLIIRNEENFAEKKTLSFNYARVLLVFMGFFLLILAFSIYVVTSILEQWLDPRHAEMVANRQIIELSMRIDTLDREVKAKDDYIRNIKLIFEGKDQAYAELNPIGDGTPTLNEESINLKDITPIDSQFRAKYEKGDLGLITIGLEESSEELREMYLFMPVEGIVSNSFNPKEDHFGLDLVAKENEPVKAVADGVVIFSSWTLDGGYVMGIQHRGNLFSVYKHNSELLKNVGNFVAGGEIVAIIGNTGELTSGPHLHFELWHKGNPVNPEGYIPF
ncbi:MAG: M23 family metallopeptidase [Cyclobacteriaceae bacterium]|nr:M23 family metallopeptidase [Cyclobacteriaceae bacterium]